MRRGTTGADAPCFEVLTGMNLTSKFQSVCAGSDPPLRTSPSGLGSFLSTSNPLQHLFIRLAVLKDPKTSPVGPLPPHAIRQH